MSKQPIVIEETVKQIQLPDPARQHEKTAAWMRRWRQVLDKDGNPRLEVTRELLTIGSGTDARVFRWHDVLNTIREYVASHTMGDLAIFYKNIADEDYSGVNSKLGVCKKIIGFYTGIDVSKMTQVQVEAFFGEWIVSQGKWGLGCPHGCGRFWPYHVENAKLVLDDPAAYTGKQAVVLDTLVIPEHEEVGMDDKPTGKIIPEYRSYLVEHWDGRITWMSEVPVNRGYLNYQDRKFTCDRCGKPVELI